MALESQDNIVDIFEKTKLFTDLKDDCYKEVLFCGMREIWNALAYQPANVNKFKDDLKNKLIHQCLKTQPEKGQEKYHLGLTESTVNALIAQVNGKPTVVINPEAEVKKRLAIILNNEAFWRLQSHSLIDLNLNRLKICVKNFLILINQIPHGKLLKH